MAFIGLKSFLFSSGNIGDAYIIIVLLYPLKMMPEVSSDSFLVEEFW